MMPLTRNIPTLRLVPPDRVLFHEHPEAARTARLVERLRRDQRLRNPPIVAPLDATRYVLLDGANRVSAFRDLGFPQVPVQVVDYADAAIQLKGWHHLLVEGGALDLHGAYAAIPGVRCERVEPTALAALLEHRQAYAALVDAAGACWGLFPRDAGAVTLHAWVRVLEAVVGAYEGRSKLERIKWADFADLPPAVERVAHQLCLFPVFTKPELMRLVGEGVMIPTGITRHLVRGRALGLNLDLGFLTALQTDAERDAHFRTFVERLEIEGRIRFYEESVFILDE
jgi:hypothetical protein